MFNQENKTLGWGVRGEGGVEIWDAEPVFRDETITLKDKLKLLFYPKKWFLYRYINKQLTTSERRDTKQLRQLRILDVGCGTGADVIDLKKMFGRKAEVVGVDVVALEIDIAREKIKRHGVWAEVLVYDGENLPFSDHSFDAIYTSDVLGHVKNVAGWLEELSRVLKPGGVLAMFAESKLGKHAFIRNFLLKRGINTDPHKEFHISLYSKEELQEKLRVAGFAVEKMYSAFWAGFWVHPEEFARRFDDADGRRFVVLRLINKVLYLVKRNLHPYSTALCELYGLAEMLLVGRFLEVQGYVILGEKRMGDVERLSFPWKRESRNR
ncbi:MAG: class I SAM-dependent methyltransferase [Candidatus Magasanikbacteria bacterium]|nr:class I SAM-dependent methyltransferase [Candidatus Magasanikbacteria bacterium]